MGSSQGIREVAGEYVWIEGACYSYLQDISKLLKSRYWEAGVDFWNRLWEDCGGNGR